ncbi:hypothetical protein SLEP1_g15579 [Rubroshorea leprosula]|uniref:C2 domain-containing protein n=1 Tax=Rubroshorea leprosula TaxID=152421 RepID=A0AAV5IX91_9ROSI|nr:hypothetical protein SLEP1_g15579 [Rubroshorea leprosula]
MSFFFGWITGLFIGIGLIVAFARYEKIRSSRRCNLASTVAAFAKITVQDTKKLIPPKNYPSWLAWLNQELDKIWPYVNEAASELIRSSVEPILEQYTPAVLQSLKFSTLTLGTKQLDFTLKVIGGDLSSIPGISDAIEETIRDAIEDSITWPVRKIISILPGDYSDLELKPVGTLDVKLVQAKDLTNKDLIGKSDPYAELFVRPLRDRIKRSKTINNQLNPIWNEHFEFIVEDESTQHLTVRVFDNEGVQASELIGCAQVAVKDLEPGKVKDIWLKLVKDLEVQRDNKNRGEVHLELLFIPSGTDSNILNPFNADFRLTSLEKTLKNGMDGTAEAAELARTTIQRKKEVIVRGVISVTVIAAENLPVVDFMGKADPYVVLVMKKSGTKVKTRVVNDTLNPVWNQTFDFVVEDALHEMLILEVWDHDTFKKEKIGNCIMTLTRVLIEGEVQDNFSLDGTQSGRIFLHIKWTPQLVFREP